MNPTPDQYRALLTLTAAAVLCLGGAAAGQDAPADPEAAKPEAAGDPDAAKLEQLRAFAQSFVDAYNKGDATAIANTFLPDGQATLASGETVAGRESIQKFYEDVFAGEEDPQGALEAGAVHFVTPGIAIEEGTFHVTMPSGEVISHNYDAVQVQQGDGSWLTASIRDSLEDLALPSEKMLALEWIIGDWEFQKNGSTTWIAFGWSEDGPYIDGKALTEQSGVESTASTYRIGWDASREGYVSWGFDALGGFTHSEWTRAGDNSWLLRTRGVTADGEGNQATQGFEVDPSRQYFTWTIRDQALGGEVQPEQTLRIVKRPPAPAAAASE